MYYLKTFFFQFLVIFFADHVLPGIVVLNQTKLPHIGGDLIFPFFLGLINSLIVPILKLIRQQVTILKIALITIVVNFSAYGIVKLLLLGIEVQTVEGYLMAASVVTICSFFISYMEMRYYQNHRTTVESSRMEPPPPNSL